MTWLLRVVMQRARDADDGLVFCEYANARSLLFVDLNTLLCRRPPLLLRRRSGCCDRHRARKRGFHQQVWQRKKSNGLSSLPGKCLAVLPVYIGFIETSNKGFLSQFHRMILESVGIVQILLVTRIPFDAAPASVRNKVRLRP